MQTLNRQVKLVYSLFAALMLAIVWPCYAETGREGDGPARKPIELGADGLPKYHHMFDNGLYSTITAMYYCGAPPEYMKANVHQTALQVPSFSKPVTVTYVKQSFPAPLVVVLLGGDGEVKGPFGDLYPYWYGHAGFNVLTFDSPFTPRFPDVSGHGVVGNFDKDTEAAVAIIDAYMKQNDPKSFTRVGVVGLSFGGSQALIMGTMAKQGKLPFELTGCLAFSPPIKLLSTAKKVDDFYKNDRQNTTMVALGKKFGGHTPVNEGQPIPFQDAEMRGALGYAFRDQLKNVVDRNDRVYGLNMLPKAGGGEDRAQHMEATSLQRYIQLYAAKYWMQKGAVGSAEEIWAMPNLERLVPNLPDFAEAVIAENDPLNNSDDLASIKAIDGGKHVTVVPTGGHLGMITSEWALIKAHHFFDKAAGPDHPVVQPAVQPAAATTPKQ